jgi:hypothetical protein
MVLHSRKHWKGGYSAFELPPSSIDPLSPTIQHTNYARLPPTHPATSRTIIPHTYVAALQSRSRYMEEFDIHPIALENAIALYN